MTQLILNLFTSTLLCPFQNESRPPACVFNALPAPSIDANVGIAPAVMPPRQALAISAAALQMEAARARNKQLQSANGPTLLLNNGKRVFTRKLVAEDEEIDFLTEVCYNTVFVQICSLCIKIYINVIYWYYMNYNMF